MLSHWLIVVPKDRAADGEVLPRIEAAISRSLYYLPDRVFCHRQANGTQQDEIDSRLRRSAPARQRCTMRTVTLAGGFGTLHILQ